MPKPTKTATSASAKPPAPPAAAVSMDLDDLERDQESRDPFVVTLAGEQYTFLDPQDLDWKDILAALTNPASFFHNCLPQEQTKAFLATSLPVWKMDKLMKAYAKHFGMPSAGEASALP
ncbi:MAG: hypothetical protein JWP14_3373 [Frankiales bacterium]|nr:hypothetical protein [Frankiales bacterium]